ncbi:hypothetical protein [Streptomyces sp. MH13]|uniref:hypothetical protein n=1 Tax=unclassified Streptomyces TaxID=2593676 RepID=UPI003CEF4594
MRDRRDGSARAPEAETRTSPLVRGGEARTGDAHGHRYSGSADRFSPAAVQRLQGTAGNAAVSMALAHHPPTSVVQRKPAKSQREEKKRARKAENQRKQLNEPRDANQKLAIATSNGYAVEARSGLGNAPLDVQDMYARLPEDKRPWSGLQRAENRAFENCAEAQLYVTLLARNKNPRSFDLATYGADEKVAPPCKNCAQWVHKEFRSVAKGNRPYKRVRD